VASRLRSLEKFFISLVKNSLVEDSSTEEIDPIKIPSSPIDRLPQISITTSLKNTTLPPPTIIEAPFTLLLTIAPPAIAVGAPSVVT